jgi:hypothetical protein
MLTMMCIMLCTSDINGLKSCRKGICIGVKSLVFQSSDFIFLYYVYDKIVFTIKYCSHYMLNKIFVPAWILFFRNLYFTENLFCRNCLNEKIVSGTYFIGTFIPPMWHLFWYLFHDQQWNLFRNEHYKNNY